MHVPLPSDAIALEPRRLGLARTHDELVDLLVARKNELQLSDAFVDDVGGLVTGHSGKILGPARVKTLGRLSLDVLLEVLACSLVLVEDGEKLARMEARYEGRDQGKVHFPKSRVAQATQKHGFDPHLAPPADIIDFVAERIRRRRAEPVPPDDGDAA